MGVEESRRSRGFLLAHLPQHPADRLLHGVVGVIHQQLGDPERVIDVAATDECERAQDGGAALHRSVGSCQRVQHVPGTVPQVLTDDPDGAPVDKVPGVDAVVSSQIELEQLAAALFGRLPAPGLPVHDADRADPDLVDRAVEQSLDLGRCQVDELLREGEHVAHPDADGLVFLVGARPTRMARAFVDRSERV